MQRIALQYSTVKDTPDPMEVNLLTGVLRCACCVVTAFYKTAEDGSCSLDKCEGMCLPLSLNISIGKQLPSSHAKTSIQYYIHKPYIATQAACKQSARQKLFIYPADYYIQNKNQVYKVWKIKKYIDDQVRKRNWVSQFAQITDLSELGRHYGCSWVYMMEQFSGLGPPCGEREERNFTTTVKTTIV